MGKVAYEVENEKEEKQRNQFHWIKHEAGTVRKEGRQKK
jgi:hypothetical protein